MMARPARMTDCPRITALLVEAQGASRFAGLVNVDEAYTRKLVAALIQRNGGTNQGGTHCAVVEDGDGTVEAFIIGVLDRVYQIGDMLVAQDMFLVASDRAPATAWQSLVDGYLAWANDNPKVFETHLSWTDAMETGPRMGPIFEGRLGFEFCGALYRKDRIASSERIAA